ncbi:MAG: tRNA pseudouridine(38-40) synthase TruA [Lachnospira sp.]|nr:tRNA pseudouridine(38-40) synthase TruA [Lachnospira sp.]
MYNYKLTIQYDGGRYDGWQRMGKDESTNTVEYKICEVLRKMTGQDIELFCGCRTEKGVHAYGQVANFKLEERRPALEISNYLNRYLPRDIAVLNVQEADARFHSQLNAKAKTYVYRVDMANIADVFERRYSYHTFDKPDLSAMRKAAQYFVGKHDFKAFTTAKKNKSTEKDIKSVDITVKGEMAEIEIKADDFLHNMARFMVGMLLDVGNGLKKPEAVRDILDGKDVQMSLPAETYGLFLKCVDYE